MVNDLLDISTDTKLRKNFNGDILLRDDACLTILSKIRGNIFVSPDCRLIVKGDIDGCVIYADTKSVIEIKVKKCAADIVLREAVLIVESGCILYGNISNDNGYLLIRGEHINPVN